jgi:hypothetical protein
LGSKALAFLIYKPARSGFFESPDQKLDEEEVSEMVDADVRLEPVLRCRDLAVVVGHHDASVTDLGARFAKLLEKDF